MILWDSKKITFSDMNVNNVTQPAISFGENVCTGLSFMDRQLHTEHPLSCVVTSTLFGLNQYLSNGPLQAPLPSLTLLTYTVGIPGLVETVRLTVSQCFLGGCPVESIALVRNISLSEAADLKSRVAPRRQRP